MWRLQKVWLAANVSVPSAGLRACGAGSGPCGAALRLGEAIDSYLDAENGGGGWRLSVLWHARL